MRRNSFDYGVINQQLVLPVGSHSLLGLHKNGKTDYYHPSRILFYPASYDYMNPLPFEDFDSPLCPQWPVLHPDKKVIFSDNEFLKSSVEDTLGGGPFDQSLYSNYNNRRVAFSNIHPVIFSHQPTKHLNFLICRDTIETYISKGGWVLIIGDYSTAFIEGMNGYYLPEFLCDRSQWQCAVKSFWDKN